MTGCVNSRKLTRNEYLLYSQTIRGNKTIPTDELEDLIPQKPNRRILRTPITMGLWFYRFGERFYDREKAQRDLEAKIKEYEVKSEALAADPKALKKYNRRHKRQVQRLQRKAEEGNWWMRTPGEPPAYFREADAGNNARKITKYLQDNGFFLARTSYTIDTLLGRRVRVAYFVQEEIPFYLRNITYEFSDPRIDSLVRASLKDSYLVSGQRYQAENVTNERIRIEDQLRNQGYYAFTRQFIPPPDADSAVGFSPDSGRRYLDLWVKIANPPGQASHPLYHIGEVEFRISQADQRRPADTVVHNGVRYLLPSRRFPVRLLDSRLLLRPDSLFRLRNYTESQRQLFLLNQFKFANINFTDTTARRLRTSITAIPLDKYQLSAETGLNVSVLNTVFPGPFLNLGMQIYNAFGGLETFEVSLRGSIERAPPFTNNPQTGNYSPLPASIFGINTVVTFPQLLFPGSARFRYLRANPKTQLSLSYNYTNRPEFVRDNFRATMVYGWQPTPRRLFNFSIIDLNLLRTPRRDLLFTRFLDTLAQQGNPLINSFRNQIVSSVIFSYTYNPNVFTQKNLASFLRATLESGGTTLNLFSTEALDRFARTTKVPLSKFLRANVDFREYLPLRRNTSLALRFNTGLIWTYYSYDTINIARRQFIAPYEKFFFGGGANSVRAWLPRRLGPGSAYPIDPQNPGQPYFRPGRRDQFFYLIEQPGDVLIEASAELRGRLFHLGGDINGALFIDAGNVWTLRNDPTRRGENFRFDRFMSEIAVGTGVGLRVDFSFFVVRLDGGIKVYDPARRYRDTEGRLIDERFILPLFSLGELFKGPNPLVLQFGIGYPF